MTDTKNTLALTLEQGQIAITTCNNTAFVLRRKHGTAQCIMCQGDTFAEVPLQCVPDNSKWVVLRCD